MDFRHAAIIARGQPVQDLRQPHPRTPIDPSHDAKVNRGNRAVIFDEQIALMHVCMEIAAADRLGKERQNQPVRQLVHVMALGLQFLDFADLCAVDPFDCHHPAIGAIPVDFRDTVARKAFHILRKLGSGRSFTPQIKLAIGPAFEIGDGKLRTQPAGFVAAQRFQMRCGPFIGLDIPRELFANAGAQHLQCNLAAVACHCAVNLRDGSGTDGLGVDFLKQLAQRLFKSCRDRRFNLAES